MGVIKFDRDFETLFNWDTDDNPTTEQDYQNAVKNWTETEMNIVDTLLWQPTTEYATGNIVKTPSLPSQYILVCTEAGDSGVAEPDYTGVSVGDAVVDGTVTWLVSTIANSGNIDALTTAVEANTQAIATNTQNISTNTENIATNTANIATNASDIANNATDIDIAEKRISNIEKLLQGNLYDYQTDTDTAYTKTVPSGAMPYAGLERLGGKTLVWNQLGLTYGRTGSVNGITFTEITTKVEYSVSGSCTSASNYTAFSNSNAVVGHKYLINVNSTNRPAEVKSYINSTLYTEDSFIITASSTTLSMAFNISVMAVDFSYKPMIHDLTLMFGSGNEPTTVEQFREMFPADYYEYNSGELLSAGVTEVVSKKADTTTIATYPIPAEIQALEGYGWSARRVHNYVDFDRKVFVKNVGAYTWDGTGWTERHTNDDGTKTYSRSVAEAIPSGYIVNANKLKQSGYADGYVGGVANMYSLGAGLSVVESSKKTVYLNTTDISATNLTLLYALSTPQEIDISAYLTDDNLISVESGGTLTFPNSNGTDYQIPIPSSETYMVDLQEAI